MVFNYIVSIFLFAIGGFIFFNRLFVIFKAIFTLKWQETTGSIIHSEMIKSEGDLPDDTVNRDIRTYSPHIIYSYQTKGKEYKSSRIFIGDNIASSFKSMAEGILKKYDNTKKITVYFNPADPHESVLQKGVNFMQIFFLLLGTIIISFSIYLFIYAQKN